MCFFFIRDYACVEIAVIPAKAGTHILLAFPRSSMTVLQSVGSRFRGNDRGVKVLSK
jgi:hypothetical protein